MTTTRYCTLAAAVALLLTSACGFEDSTLTPVGPAGLTLESYASYRANIGPQESDEAWQRVDWVPSYRQGLETAAKEQMPILLWVMNGHPLGCT